MRFILVGGVSAVLQGAAINTFDLDVVHSTDGESVDRLLAALESLEAYYRAQPERRLRPTSSHLISLRHQTLMTKHGALDVLGHIGRGRSYADLIKHTVEMNIDPDLKVFVLDLETLISAKEEVAGEKDLAVLPILRSVLKVRSGKSVRKEYGERS